MLVKSAKGSESYKARIKGLKGKKLANEIKLIESENRARAREIMRQRKNQHAVHWLNAEEYNKRIPDDTEDGRYKTEGISSVSGRKYKIIHGEIYYEN